MEMGLTAKELAQRASVTPGYISQIEHDQIKPSMNAFRFHAIFSDRLSFFVS